MEQNRRSMPCRVCLIVVFGLLCSAAGFAEGGRTDRPSPETAEFVFARVRYDSTGGMNEAYYYYEGRYWMRWETDYPQADENFLFRFRELTTTSAHPRPVTLRLTDPDLADFPFLYLCDVGWMDLDAAEVVALRDYLLRGGFLWMDDFWGWAEWANVERVFAQVLPEITWQDIPPGHPIYSMVFDLEELPQVPARDFAALGHDPPEIHRYPARNVTPAHLRGYFDEFGRLLVVATHNTDIGDGWEREAYGEWYFEKYSTVAYATGVNIIVYGLSH
jgi:hypothetical protein